MNKLTKLACLSLFLLFSASISSAAPKDYRYTTVPNDPLKARIYTLDNGLKVYMTVNKETPRIQTYNLKCIAKQRMKLSAKPSIMLSTVCHTKLQNMPFPMNMTN